MCSNRSRNKQEITYYKDYDNPSEFFGKESIIELPNAPAFITPCSLNKAKEHREQCKKEHRFFACELNFLETSLKMFQAITKILNNLHENIGSICLLITINKQHLTL